MVLFLVVNNSCHSPITLGFCQKLNYSFHLHQHSTSFNLDPRHISLVLKCTARTNTDCYGCILSFDKNGMVLFKGSSCLCVLLLFFILLGPACGFMLSTAGARPSCFSSVLGHAAQCQHIKADVAYAHRFVQVKFDDGDLFYRALMAEQTPTMAAKRERKNKE